MKIVRCLRNQLLYLIFLIIFVACLFPSEPTQFLLGKVSGNEVFESDIYNENISIPISTIKTLDFHLENGNKFEIIYSVQVKEGLPIDIWLVNEDNYLLLISDVNFLYYIDGSDSDVSYARKIAFLSEEGNYKLVLANVDNNQTVSVIVASEIRTFRSVSNESSSEDPLFLIYLLMAVIILLGIFVIVLVLKNRVYKQKISKASYESSKKKKLKKRKAKRIVETEHDDEFSERTPQKKVNKSKLSTRDSTKVYNNNIPKKVESENSNKILPKFCGDCGSPVASTFCTNCGQKVQVI